MDALKSNELPINKEELHTFFDNIKDKNKKLDFEEFKKIVLK
jgi:hypothetical protein